MEYQLGRIKPNDFNHVKLYGYTPEQTPTNVEKSLTLPKWHENWDQGQEGACVGFGTSMMMSILNGGERYAARWLWQAAKNYDQIASTKQGDKNGTTVSGACDVLRVIGHRPLIKGELGPETPSDGIITNSWATSTDQMRAAIDENLSISIGVNWYTNFDRPVYSKTTGEYVIGDGSLGTVRGGHCVCIYGASDRRQAFALKNSWGKNYPLVWITYDAMERLLNEDGEAALVTDKQ